MAALGNKKPGELALAGSGKNGCFLFSRIFNAPAS
jgi:hypothetical protein